MGRSTRSSVAFLESFSYGDIEFWLKKLELCLEANKCMKEDTMLKRLLTLYVEKHSQRLERLEEGEKEFFKSVREALVAAFGGDAT